MKNRSLIQRLIEAFKEFYKDPKNQDFIYKSFLKAGCLILSLALLTSILAGCDTNKKNELPINPEIVQSDKLITEDENKKAAYINRESLHDLKEVFSNVGISFGDNTIHCGDISERVYYNVNNGDTGAGAGCYIDLKGCPDRLYLNAPDVQIFEMPIQDEGYSYTSSDFHSSTILPIPEGYVKCPNCYPEEQTTTLAE